ncbi:MAG: hypothetical protein WAO91_03350 [Candidatus Nitrosotenuis sp.]
MNNRIKNMKTIVVALSTIVLVGLAMGAYQYSQQTQTTNSEDLLGEPKNVQTPVNLPRSGVPSLVAYPLSIEPSNYHTIDLTDNAMIAKVIKKGEIVISEQEVKEYFTITADDNYLFGIKMPDGVTKYYSIEYREIPISLDVPTIKAYRLDTEPDTFIPVNSRSHSWLKNAVDNEFRWQAIDVPSAVALRQITNNENFNLKVTFDDSHSEFYNIRYFGPALETIGGS